MQDERFLGHIHRYDPIKQVIEIQVDFMTPEQLEIIENIMKDKFEFSFFFSKPFRRSKSYAQLKKYYLLLSKILTKLEVFPSSDNIKAFDLEIKKTVFPTQMIEVYNKKIPVIPSKSNMTVEEMSQMIEVVEESYGKILEDDSGNF